MSFPLGARGLKYQFVPCGKNMKLELSAMCLPAPEIHCWIRRICHQLERRKSTLTKKQRIKTKRVLRMSNLLIGFLETQRPSSFSMITKPSNQIPFWAKLDSAMYNQECSANMRHDISEKVKNHVQPREDKDSHVEKEEREPRRYRVWTDAGFRKKVSRQERTRANK